MVVSQNFSKYLNKEYVSKFEGVHFMEYNHVKYEFSKFEIFLIIQ